NGQGQEVETLQLFDASYGRVRLPKPGDLHRLRHLPEPGDLHLHNFPDAPYEPHLERFLLQLLLPEAAHVADLDGEDEAARLFERLSVRLQKSHRELLSWADRRDRRT